MSQQRRIVTNQAKADPRAPKQSERTGRKQLLEYHEIPSWQQENEFILTGYRPTSGSYAFTFLYQRFRKQVLITFEVSTYSHIIGALLFALLPFLLYREFHSRYLRASIADIIVFSTFFYGVAICLALSATCHIIWNHSPKYASFGNKLDYLGIVILMWGSTIPTEYYGFYCDPHLQIGYWSMTAILYLGCCFLTINPKFSRPEFRSYRAAMYSASGFSAVFFIAHGLLRYGWVIQNQRMALVWMGLMAFFNLVGAAFYAARIPEAWYPHTFDIFGGSHQIFHIMVIFAALAHMFGLLQAFDHIHAEEFKCL